ncbi:MAG: 30S ribosomal protein S2 [Candidatus Staskawiczbacteria bacterium RIFOXYD1_FULL_39_28]|uniref:Small ribosomal subunit protein uS2 n=1 Tax=Candidatus Staskawiczbacteria bacterium RIFOXYC1_FULL_38_18 TaxID=1802229 RepID=A0A1G2JEI9_9BACT|nr:MAG: 30S ribosomal protein S2 [Candidatus Staskawiczbacteria bacterium RIFOXYC1_FULL_38_18]OGZ92374.1 MAG: 30S ribosomal protein S2 [Candidatus Staskawiczbacteria bacterium RIFOXYD1_FULL_39_28]
MAKDIKTSVEEMAAAGVNFGHKVSKLHPKMKQYVSGIKNNVHLFDLEKTEKELEKALKFIAKTITDGKSIVFIGTKAQLKAIVQKSAEECGLPYVTERWLGGTFTNFETIQKRVAYFKDLEAKRASGGLDKYTKKERLDFDKELVILKTKFEGVRNMTKLPDVVFIAGIDRDITAAREAKKKGIKIVAIVDTNVNPDIVDYPIPANDDSIGSVQYLLEKIKNCIIESRQVKA